MTHSSYANEMHLPKSECNERYEFLGWYTEPDGGVEVTEDTIMSLHDDHKLYARWIEKELICADFCRLQT